MAIIPSLDIPRFTKVLTRLDGLDDGERMCAFNAATALLTAAGMTWKDVLVSSVLPKPDVAPVVANPWEDIFGGQFFSKTPSRAPEPEPEPDLPPLTVACSGGNIPPHLDGTVSVMDDRITQRTGLRMLAIRITVVEDHLTFVYGPMTVFDVATIEAIGVNPTGRIVGQCSMPRDPTHGYEPTFRLAR